MINKKIEKIYIASDHAGFDLKEKIKKSFEKEKFDLEDLGPKEYKKTDDYPDYAEKLSKKVSRERNSKGILICGSGQGVCMTANKFKGVYAALAYDVDSAEHSVKHDHVNVLCLPGRDMGKAKAIKIIKNWLKTKPSSAKRHQRRVNKIKRIENKNFKK